MTNKQHSCCNRRALSFKMWRLASANTTGMKEKGRNYLEWHQLGSTPNILGMPLHTC